MEPDEYSFEWYKQNLPEGITINCINHGKVYLDIDMDEYPSKMDQMGIINWIELGMTQAPLEMYYSISDREYVSAYTFREMNGYDNSFFKGCE